MTPTIDQLREEREAILKYLLAKFYVEDWHGVADAAMDLREIDSKLEVLTNSTPKEEKKSAGTWESSDGCNLDEPMRMGMNSMREK